MEVDFVTLIGNIGFPIVACIFLAKQNQSWVNVINEVTSTLKAMELRLAEIENSIKITKGEEKDDVN